VGLSEVGIKDLERARKVLPIVSVQNLYNLGTRKWEDVLDYTTKEKIAFIPWYPLASGPGKLQEITGKIATKHKATAAQIALAWLLKRSDNILLIPGTKSLQHLKENIESSMVELSDEDFDVLSR
jgi:pyridoxine 4-dehydrogenase